MRGAVAVDAGGLVVEALGGVAGDLGGLGGVVAVGTAGLKTAN
jgi:hypothetical protein